MLDKKFTDQAYDGGGDATMCPHVHYLFFTDEEHLRRILFLAQRRFTIPLRFHIANTETPRKRNRRATRASDPEAVR